MWTIQELVSSIINNTKAYRLKQEFSQYGYFVLILSSSEKGMKRISSGMAQYIRKNHKEIYVTEICRFKKSRRKKYFIEETEEAFAAMGEYKGV